MSLKPVLGPIQLIFYSVGVIVGAGVYSVIGSAAGLAQGSLWLSFVIGAGVALLTAFSYAEMATSFPIAGAEYAYIRQAWPRADWLSFSVGIVILLAWGSHGSHGLNGVRRLSPHLCRCACHGCRTGFARSLLCSEHLGLTRVQLD